MPKQVTDHQNGDKHTRTIVYRDDEGHPTRIVEQRVVDTIFGEASATNTSVTTFDSHGNSYTKHK